MRDYIDAGNNGFLVDVGDIGGFVNAAQRLLVDPTLCMNVGNSAALHSKQYTWARCAIETLDFYESLLKNSDRLVQKLA